MIPITPANQVTPIKNFPFSWNAIGNSPNFNLPVPLIPKHGWMRIQCRGASETPRTLVLYADSGSGFSEQHKIPVGSLTEHLENVTQYFHLPKNTKAIRLRAGENCGQFQLSVLHFSASHPMAVAFVVIAKSLRRATQHHVSLSLLLNDIRNYGVKEVWRKQLHRIFYRNAEVLTPYRPETHSQILGRAESMHAQIKTWTTKPTISLIVPVYNPNPFHLQACIDSVTTQIYPHWQLCLADDCSTNPDIRILLDKAAATDKRISLTYRTENGHISQASNSALELAIGDYVALLDHDDLIPPHALFEVVKTINATPDIDYIYSDEDLIDESGRRFNPTFKPDWLPDLLDGMMYTCHLSVYRRKLVNDIGGFRTGFEGSQDHDLCLRIRERNPNVNHIPLVLYHWRVHDKSTANYSLTKPYAKIAGLRAVNESLMRRGEEGHADHTQDCPGVYYTCYPVKNTPLVSIIIPTRDNPSLLKNCLTSLFNKTSYQNFHVQIIDNGSVKPETIKLIDHLTFLFPNRFSVKRFDIPFNFSRLVNLGADNAKGEYILLLNDDTEIIAENWLTEMLGWAQRPSIGAVGAMLLYPDNTIQHAGVILGINDATGHAHHLFPASDGGYSHRLIVPSPYTAVTGACLLVRHSLFQHVGGFDESLPVAFNDVDFCCKLIKAKYQNIVIPNARLYHHESKSRGTDITSKKINRYNSELQIFQSKWKDLIDHDPAYNPNLTRTSEDFSLKTSPF